MPKSTSLIFKKYIINIRLFVYLSKLLIFINNYRGGVEGKLKFYPKKSFFNNMSNLNSKILYKNIISIENLEKGLLRSKSSVSHGLQNKVDLNGDKIKLLFKDLKSQRYKPTPIQKICMEKPKGDKKLLSVAFQRDSIVQAAILNELEPVLNILFLDCSYANRPGINPHNALKAIKTKWHNVTWIIKINTHTQYETINYSELLDKLKFFCDQPAVELISKFIKSGYLDSFTHPNKLELTKLNTLPRSLIAPILLNFYLHPLDCFIRDKLIAKWNFGSKPKYTTDYIASKNLTEKEIELIYKLNVEGAEKTVGKLKHSHLIADSLNNCNSFRRLYYARYLDDLILGFKGTKAEAVLIKTQIEMYLKNNCFLNLDKTKNSVKHSGDKFIEYLGFYIRYIPNNEIPTAFSDPVKNKSVKHNFLKKSNVTDKVRLRIPVERLLKNAINLGCAKLKTDKESIRATSCRKLLYLEDKYIIRRYSVLIHNFIEYYSPANRFSDLWQIVALYRKSCALTLADKHKLRTAASAFKKYGANLKVQDDTKNKFSALFYPTSLKTTNNFKLGKKSICMPDNIFE